MARYTLPVITSFETPKRYRKRNRRIKCYFNIILTCGKTNILPFLFPASCTFILKFEFKFKQCYHILFFLCIHQCLFSAYGFVYHFYFKQDTDLCVLHSLISLYICQAYFSLSILPLATWILFIQYDTIYPNKIWFN